MMIDKALEQYLSQQHSQEHSQQRTQHLNKGMEQGIEQGVTSELIPVLMPELTQGSTSRYAIQVSVEQQQCTVFDIVGGKQAQVHCQYDISTASKGISCQKNSYGTPIGLHTIKECIGDKMPIGTRFVGRVATAEQVKIEMTAPQVAPQGDYILTRILRLSGLEPSVNLGGDVDSFARYIYFHGTNEEYLIGTPASHGCIRMRNADIVELFSLVTLGTPVYIK